MDGFIASGRIVDLVLAVLVVEIIALSAWNRRTGRGPSPGTLLLMALPGACLMLAMRTALTGAAHSWLLLLLVAAFVAHLADLRSRW